MVSLSGHFHPLYLFFLVAQIIKNSVVVNEAYGYAEIDVNSISHLPAMTLNRLFTKLLMYASGLHYPPSLRSVQTLLTSHIHHRPTQLATQAVGGCLVFALRRTHHDKPTTLVFCRQPAARGSERQQEVVVSKPLWWDGRFVISSQFYGKLSCLSSQLLPTSSGQFYVRSLKKTDFEFLKHDGNSCEVLSSVPLFCRLALPVICDAKSNDVVSIPHIGCTKRSPEIAWTVTPCPRHLLPWPQENHIVPKVSQVVVSILPYSVSRAHQNADGILDLRIN